MPEQAGTKCKREVKDEHGAIKKCDTFLPRGKPECPKKNDHMWRFQSGFCNDGWHEGSSPVDSSGRPVKGCHLWMQCNCDCHRQIDKMFEMTGEIRIFMENPKYRTAKSPFVMPDPIEIAQLRLQDELEKAAAIRPMVTQSNKPAHFTETPTGKRARGQLEYEVLRVCQQFMKGQLEVEILTPNVIAMEIDEVEPPSVGAIGAVFDRWTKLGFAVCEKKPVRFTSFTAEGQLHGLDAMKARSKRDNKMKRSAEARGSLRPRK